MARRRDFDHPFPARCGAVEWLAALAVGWAAVAGCRPPAPPNERAPALQPAAPARPAPAAPEPARTADPAPVTPEEPSKPASGEPAPPPSSSGEPSTEALLAPQFVDARAPERFTVKLETTAEPLTIDVRRSWAPLGADRFYSLVRAGYYDGDAFFRVVPGFVAQFGLHGDPAVNRRFRARRIGDDPVQQSNVAGLVAFAAAGKGTRTTQVFINLQDNPQLDRLGFAPFGRVREIEVAKKLYAGYGDAPPAGRGPQQARIEREGRRYLAAAFPKLDAIRKATIVDEKPSR